MDRLIVESRFWRNREIRRANELARRFREARNRGERGASELAQELHRAEKTVVFCLERHQFVSGYGEVSRW